MSLQLPINTNLGSDNRPVIRLSSDSVFNQQRHYIPVNDVQAIASLPVVGLRASTGSEVLAKISTLAGNEAKSQAEYPQLLADALNQSPPDYTSMKILVALGARGDEVMPGLEQTFLERATELQDAFAIKILSHGQTLRP